MNLSYACPVGTAICDDVHNINLAVPLFPLAVALAFLVAWPVRRFLPPHPMFGWSLAIIGAVVYLYYSELAAGLLVGLVVGAIGIGLAQGKRIAEPQRIL
jgi:hypothetical protein